MYEKLREPQVAYRPEKHGDRNERGAYAIVSWYDGYVVARRRRRRSARDHVLSSSSSSSRSSRRRRRRREPRRCRRVRVREDFASRPLHRRRWRPSRNALHQSFFCFATTMMITPKSSTKIVIDFRSTSLSNRRRRRPQGTTKARRRPVQNRKRRRRRRRRHRESSNRSKKNVVVPLCLPRREIFLKFLLRKQEGGEKRRTQSLY